MTEQLEFRTEPTVKLIDSMGDDSRAAWAARGSTGGGEGSAERDKKLVKSLVELGHLVPLEHCVMTWEIEMSVSVARQLVKTRTSSWSELSARYREIPPVFYLPHPDRPLGQKGKPMDYDYIEVGWEEIDAADDAIRYSCQVAWDNYQGMLEDGIAREVARSVLPECRGTNVRWTMNLVTALRLMSLRVDWEKCGKTVSRRSHVQDETERVALLMWEEMKKKWPAACAAFEESGYAL